jgi:hypothetical protein
VQQQLFGVGQPAEELPARFRQLIVECEVTEPYVLAPELLEGLPRI